MRPALVATLLVVGCAARQPEPVGQVVWADPAARGAGGELIAPAATVSPTTARPRPMTVTLPALTLGNLRFRDVHECGAGECVHAGSPVAPGAVAVEDGATTLPPTSAWVQVIRPGAAVQLPADPAVDVLGVTLVGAVSIESPSAAGGSAARAVAWTAFRAPGAGVVLRAVGAEPAAAVLIRASGGGSEAPARPVLHDLSTGETLRWAGGAMHARIAFEGQASPRASLGLLFASDDAAVAEHAHPGAWETLIALSAAGHLHLPAQRAGDRELPARDRTVTDGTIVYVPAGVRHAWVPDGTHPLVAIQLYSPPGPEQRFRALAATPETSP